MNFWHIFLNEFPFHKSLMICTQNLDKLEKLQQQKKENIIGLQLKKLKKKTEQNDKKKEKKQQIIELEYKNHVARQIKRERKQQRFVRKMIWNAEQKKLID
jgi:NAD-dependent SIR2 family protein deacetylase